jgi:tRNA (adenine57-N1/adenine58-N1)-methyltransferase
MDFAKKLVKHENVITKSGIKLLPLPSETPPSAGDVGDVGDIDTPVDDEIEKKKRIEVMLVEAANKAATELFLSSGTKIYSTINKHKFKQSPPPASTEPTSTSTSATTDNGETKPNPKESLVDCKLYPTQLLPPSSKIVPSSLVVIFESFDSLDFVYAKPGEVFHNRNGHFHHDDFINKPYGCKIRSRNNQGVGFVYLLKPTPELWQRSLNHRTQIVHELDASLITFELNLRPNMVVCESGTGSGALSHCIMRTIAPFGKLNTFEFNHARVKAAREEFKKNGLDHLVQVHWRDVCGKPKSFEEGKSGAQTSGEDDNQETIGVGGFCIGAAKADAIFLDLPEPWSAIPHAAYTIKPYGSICSYSPCVEQSQQTIIEMKKYGFHSVKTIEVRLREHYVDEVEMNHVPTMKLPRQPFVPFIHGSSDNMRGDQSKHNTEKNGEQTKDNKNNEGEKVTEEKNGEQSKNDKRALPNQATPSKKRKMFCARPFATIKGHTAFLTFAHAGNKAHPDPHENANK